MAQRRVQVERLRPSTTITPVARPVETYVRPPEAPVQESELGAFVRAIAPAMDTMAKVKQEKELKRVREIEKGIAAKRTLDAKLGLGKAVREANQDYLDNQDLYLTLSTEEVAERRQNIFQPYIDMAEQSGDELLSTAIQGDLELANINFFTQTLDPARQAYQDNKTLEDAGTEILAISRNTNVNDKESYMNGMAAIDDIVNSVHKATGIPYRTLNEYMLNLYKPTAQEEGRTGLYAWLNGGNQEKQNILNTSWAAESMKTINSNLRTYDNRVLTASEDAEFAAFQIQALGSFLETGQRIDLGESQKFTARSGKEFTIKLEDYVPLYEQWANENNVGLDARFEQFYVPLNVVPTGFKNNIQSGKSIFSHGLVTDPANTEAAAKALTAYKALQKYGIVIPNTLMSEDEKRRMRIAEFYLDEAGVGLDVTVAPLGAIQTALGMAQGANLDIKPSVRITNEKFRESVDTTWFTKNFSDAVNIGVISQAVRDAAGIYMQAEGADAARALEKAKADVIEDFVQSSTSNGKVVGIRMLNTGMTKANAAQVNGYISEAAKLPSVQRIQDFAGGSGIGLFNSGNPNKLGLYIVGEEGERLQLLGEVDVAELSNPETIPNIIALRINQLAEQGYNVPDITGSTAEPVEETDIAASIIDNVAPDTIVGQLAQQAVAQDTDISAPTVLALPDKFVPDSITPLMQDGELTGYYLYSGTVNGEPYIAKSSVPPSEVRSVPPTTMLEDIPPDFVNKTIGEVVEEVAPQLEQAVSEIQPDDMDEQISKAFEQTAEFAEKGYDKIREAALQSYATKAMQGEGGVMPDNTTQKASNLIKELEGFEAKPYKDGKDRSVGYGFYIPSLTDDEKALIKDINNITQAEADAVMELKVSKLEAFWNENVPNFSTFSQEAQAALISMAYQLGDVNVKNKFPTFFANLVEAANAPVGSVERQQFLDIASGNMLFNYDASGNITSKTRWHKQTANRARAMALLVSKG